MVNKIVITLDRSKIGDSGYEENIVYLLRKLANRFEDGEEPLKVMDINGNSVGTVEYK
jgi:hypothetical protein